jgi:hypothetical protein
LTAPEFFRFLIVARIALGVIVRVTGLLPWDHQRVLGYDSLGPFLVLLLELPIAVASVVIIIGLWNFRWWARTAYVAISIVYVGAAIFFPSPLPSEPSPIVAAFAYFTVLSQGVLITMAFLPPLSERFERTKV